MLAVGSTNISSTYVAAESGEIAWETAATAALQLHSNSRVAARNVVKRDFTSRKLLISCYNCSSCVLCKVQEPGEAV